MAEVLAIVAAFCFALAATLQQKGALGMGDSLASAKSYLQLLKQMWWLVGTVVLLGGYIFQAIALDNGQLAVVQPLLVTTIVFALPLGYLLTSQKVNRTEVGAAVLVVVGLAVFTVVGDEGEGRNNAPGWEWAIAIAAFGLIAVVLVVLGGRGDVARKAALFGATAGILYGLSASLWKPTADIIDSGGLESALTSWEFVAFAAAGILAFVIQQVSLATGQLAASVATVSVCNPLVSIVIGILLLEETLADPTWHKVVAYIGLGAALYGAILITKATEGPKEAEAGEGPTPTPAPAPAT